MHLLYVDETNLSPEASTFFIYGGICIHSERAADLAGEIAQLRAQFGYEREALLKFNTRERPATVSDEQHRDIKREVVASCTRHGVRIFFVFVHHAIATSSEDARLFAINTVCYNFDVYLQTEQPKSHGLVVIDTFKDDRLFNHLRQKISVGLTGSLPYSDDLSLKRILGIHMATIGSSHFCSAADIVLGCMRVAVNDMDAKRELALELLGPLKPMVVEHSPTRARDLSVAYSPRRIDFARYRDDYKKLHSFFTQIAGWPIKRAPDRP